MSDTKSKCNANEKVMESVGVEPGQHLSSVRFLELDRRSLVESSPPSVEKTMSGHRVEESPVETNRGSIPQRLEGYQSMFMLMARISD
jgi:hypothetical protein